MQQVMNFFVSLSCRASTILRPWNDKTHPKAADDNVTQLRFIR